MKWKSLKNLYTSNKQLRDFQIQKSFDQIILHLIRLASRSISQHATLYKYNVQEFKKKNFKRHLWIYDIQWISKAMTNVNIHSYIYILIQTYKFEYPFQSTNQGDIFFDMKPYLHGIR